MILSDLRSASRPTRLLGVVAILSVSLTLTACGDNPPSTPNAAANASVRCPSLTLDVSSFDSVLGGSIDVSAGAADPDSSAPVAYSWTASAGAFEDPSARTTAYICPRSADVGAQLIRVSATRGVCTVSQPLVVICLAPIADAGAGGWSGSDGTGGARGAADAGAGGGAGDASDGAAGCGIDPTTDEGASCNQCTTANCTTYENAKKGVPPTAGCHHLASDRERQSCQTLYCCIRSSNCVKNGDPTACWCGTADPNKCALGTEAANGPCVQEVEDAAGTTQAPEIASRMVDPTFPLGGAANLAICRATFCADSPSPACQGF
jgi:hypothetical protein